MVEEVVKGWFLVYHYLPKEESKFHYVTDEFYLPSEKYNLKYLALEFFFYSPWRPLQLIPKQ